MQEVRSMFQLKCSVVFISVTKSFIIITQNLLQKRKKPIYDSVAYQFWFLKNQYYKVIRNMLKNVFKIKISDVSQSLKTIITIQSYVLNPVANYTCWWLHKKKKRLKPISVKRYMNSCFITVVYHMIHCGFSYQNLFIIIT